MAGAAGDTTGTSAFAGSAFFLRTQGRPLIQHLGVRGPVRVGGQTAWEQPLLSAQGPPGTEAAGAGQGARMLDPTVMRSLGASGRAGHA